MEDNNNVKNENQENLKDQNFVPAYKRDNTQETANKVTMDKKKNERKNKKIFKSKITLILICLIVIICIILCVKLISNSKLGFSNYDSLMEKYGFAVMYDNNKAEPKDEVTKSELIKLVVSCYLNTDDVTQSMAEYIESENLEYANQNYVLYAQNSGLLLKDEITSSNQNQKATYLDAIKYISKAKQKILGKNLDIDQTPKFKDYSKYSDEEKWYIADDAHNNIIEDSSSNINGKKVLTKSKLDEMLIKAIVEYNLITLDGDRINIKQEKMPSNKADFPYTLSNVDKTVYEKSYIKLDEKEFKNPLEIYSSLKFKYTTINNEVLSYVNAIFNIDYENFDENSFKENIYEATNYVVKSEDINDYIKKIKDNKIRITATSKLQFPVIYFDGQNYRARVKVSYNLKTTENLNSVLFKDNEDTSYALGEKTIYVDIPFKIDDEYDVIYIVANPLIENIVK